MIKLTNEIFNNSNFYEAIKKINDSTLFSPRDAYNLHRLAKELTEKAVAFEAVRAKALAKHGEKDEEKGIFKFKADASQAFEADMADLLGIEIELDFAKIPFPEGLALTPAEIYAVEPFFDFKAFDK